MQAAEILFRCSSIGKLMTEPRSKSEGPLAFCPACFVEVSAEEADQQTLDARRYRWLRDEGNTLDGNEPFLAGTELDEAIDAAIRSEAPREKGDERG